MHAPSLTIRAGLLAAASALALTGTRAQSTDAFPTFESYIKISGQKASVSGNDAAYARRFQTPAEGSAGIEALHIYKDLNDTTNLTLDGHALSGAEDYLGSIKLANDRYGSVEVGYKRFRTFYDGVGGFFPLNNAWFPLSPEELHTDRARFWTEYNFKPETGPSVTLRYVNEARTGEKDSTIWGDSNLTGLPTVPSNNATRKILPSYIDLSERHQLLEGVVSQAIGKTTVKLRVLNDRVNNYDTRYVVTNLGESSQKSKYQADGIDSSATSFIATTDTVFNDHFTLDTGLSYRRVASDSSGERPTSIGTAPTADFQDLAAATAADIYTANASLCYRPTIHWFIQTSMRYEDNYTKSAGSYNKVAGTLAAPTYTLYYVDSRVKEKDYTPEVSVRYTGIKNLSLYATANDRIVNGDDRNTKAYNTLVPSVSSLNRDDISQDQAHYTLGANWNVASRLTLRSEIFHKDHENKFIGYDNQLGQSYVLGYQFTGVKLTAIVKVTPELSFTTRYQPQVGKMNVTTDSTDKFQSMDAKSHLIGETVDWTPNNAFYAQANLNVGFNYISTAYPLAGTPSTQAPQANSDNNYVTGSLLSGFILSKVDDVQAQFTCQRANNFQPALATGTQPYGSSFEEYVVSVALKHKFSDHLIGHAKVGYLSSRDDTTGHNTDFDGPLAYASVEYGF